MFPPLLGQDLFFVPGHGIVGFDYVARLNTSSDPDFLLVVFKVSLLCALPLKVEVEPFEKLTSHDQQVG